MKTHATIHTKSHHPAIDPTTSGAHKNHEHGSGTIAHDTGIGVAHGLNTF